MPANDLPAYSDHTWQECLKGGFGFETYTFANHPSERSFALAMFYKSWINGVSLQEINSEATIYLREKGVEEKFIPEKVLEIERFYKSIILIKRMQKAWLIFWEPTEDSQLKSELLISIRDPRTSTKRIEEFIEEYYISTRFSPKQKLYFSTRKKKNPYTIQRHTRYSFILEYGASPRIFARIVKNIEIFESNGKEFISWEEI